MLNFYYSRLFDEASEGSEGSEGNSEETTETTETNTEEETTDSEDSETEDEPEIDAVKAKQGMALIELLSGPQAAQVIEMLAKKSGLTVSATKQEINQAKQTIEEVLEEEMGDDFKFLSGKLGKALKRVIDIKLAEVTNQVTEVSNRAEIARIEHQVDSALTSLSRETKGESDKHKEEMIRLMDKYPMGKDITMKEYLHGLYQMSTAKSSESSAKRRIANKINENANNIGDRIGNKGGGSTESVKSGTGKGLTLDEAVTQAMKQLKLK